MLHIILYQPEIPQNTGNIGRLCAITQSVLHLIHPLGFKINDRYLKRSSMDYWQSLTVHEYANWEAFVISKHRPKRIWLFTTKAKKNCFWEASFLDGDGFLFGNESSGCPDFVHDWVGQSYRITIPHYDSKLRSLNLANCAGIAIYEALRQIRPF